MIKVLRKELIVNIMKDEFRKIVEHNFFFLEEEFGFMKSIEQSNIIWYSKQKVVIQVAWDFFRSSELSFFIGFSLCFNYF